VRPSLDSYAHLAGGKVRDLYTIDDEHLLLVASDRISAYDHVLSTPIQDKGRVLTAMSVFFFGVLGGNISFEAVVEKVGQDLAVKLRDDTLDIYGRASNFAADRGIILADTKLEFGLDPQGNLVLADEVLTPDSSRYWPADGYEAGKVQPSFDKQFVRNWLTGPESGWDRASDTPPPPLPAEIVEATRERYIEAYERISGLSFADWVG